MAVSRKQYISVDELNEIVNGDYADDNETLQLIYEASELISYHTLGKSDYVTVDSDVENLLKLATGYQVDYFANNVMIDDDYDTGSVSLGRYSVNEGTSGVAEYKKVAPKCNRYLMQAGLLYRGADYRMTSYID